MPTTKTKTKPAARSAEPKPERQHAWRPDNIAQQAKANTKDELKREMDEFLDNGRAEEIKFMLEVLRERDSNAGSRFARNLREHDVPLFSAIQSTIENGSSRCVMLLPDADMEPKVAEFITELETQAAADPALLEYQQKSSDQILEMRRADLTRYIARFCTEATWSDLFFLVSVMARWADILEYDVQPESPIMSALQFELDHEHWVLKVPYNLHTKELETLVRLAAAKDWLGKLLAWIAEEHKDGLTPCDIGKKAFAYQREFDEQAAKAQSEAAA